MNARNSITISELTTDFWLISTDYKTKFRNTLVFRLKDEWAFIDPQEETLSSITEIVGDCKMPASIIISHEHENHFSGTDELLARHDLSALYISNGCSSLEKLYVSLKGKYGKRVRVLDREKDYRLGTNDRFMKLRLASGHSCSLIVCDIVTSDNDYLFCSDNLCTSFPAPVTGCGNIKCLLNFYDSELASPKNRTGYIPGHGLLVASSSQFQQAKEYYQAIYSGRQQQWPPGLLHRKLVNIAGIFHELNLQAGKGKDV